MPQNLRIRLHQRSRKKTQESNAEIQTASAATEPEASVEPAPSKDAEGTDAPAAEEVKQASEVVSNDVPQADEKPGEVTTDAAEESKPSEIPPVSTDMEGTAGSNESEAPATKEKQSDS